MRRRRRKRKTKPPRRCAIGDASAHLWLTFARVQLNASVALLDDMSVVLGDADCSVVLYDDDDDEARAAPVQAVLRSPSPEVRQKARAKPSAAAPQVGSMERYNSAVLTARELERVGDTAGALSAYMEMLEPGGCASKERDAELVQKVVFLKQLLVTGNAAVTTSDARPCTAVAVPATPCDADDDVELFDDDDDDAQLLNTLQRALVLDSPVAAVPIHVAPPSPPKEDNKLASRECVICWERERGAAFLPCGHLVSCGPCARNLTKCPVCRGVIVSTLPIFMT